MNPTVMVIDSNPESRESAVALTRAAGLHVAYEGRHGIDALQAAANDRPDVLVVAVEEPIARSMQTLDFVRELQPGCAVVAYATNPRPEVARRVMRSAAVDLLRAPLSPVDFAVAIETALARLQREAAVSAEIAGGQGQVFAVVGQKGGIGKTTIATNLAAALASRTPDSVLIIDLDTRFGDVALAMGTDASLSAAAAARSLAQLDRDSFMHMLARDESGAYVLPAPARLSEWVDVGADEIKALVAAASDLFEYVVLDTPGTLNEIVAVAIDVATRVIAVTSTDITSIKNTNLLMAYLDGHGVARENIVMTVSHNLEPNATTSQVIADLLETVIDHEIPFARAAARGSLLGRPVVFAEPTSEVAHAYAALTSMVAKRPITMPMAAARRGWLGWMTRRQQPQTGGPITPALPSDERVLVGAHQV